MKKESNKYIFLYSGGLVVLVAAVLTLASVWLTPYQQKNVEVEKKLNILRSVQKAELADEVDDKKEYVEAEYKKYITHTKVVNVLGNEVEGDAFEVELEVEIAKPKGERRLPVFICTKDDSSVRYILPVRGAGLWGPLWGYVALKSDMSTIDGVIFDHKGETPGLGAEISTRGFCRQFEGKQLFEGDKFVPLAIKKGGGTNDLPHAVDAVSGGTITSEGVQAMLENVLTQYVPFLDKQRKIQPEAPKEEEVIVVPPPKRVYVPRPDSSSQAAESQAQSQSSLGETSDKGTENNAVAPEKVSTESSVGSEKPAATPPSQEEKIISE